MTPFLAPALPALQMALVAIHRGIYLASSGDSDAAASIAGETAVVALRDINNRDDLRMAGRALSWAVMACSLAQAAKVDNLYASRRSLSRMLQGYERDFEGAIRRASKRREPEEEPPVTDDLAEVVGNETLGVADREGSIIVFTSVGNDVTSEGKRVVNEFEAFVRRRLPLPVTLTFCSV